MNKKPLIWLTKQVKRRIPGLAVLTASQMGYSLLCVFFALGSRGVIDAAVAGDPGLFLQACLYQGGIIAGILICLTVFRHLKERLRADLERACAASGRRFC